MMAMNFEMFERLLNDLSNGVQVLSFLATALLALLRQLKGVPASTLKVWIPITMSFFVVFSAIAYFAYGRFMFIPVRTPEKMSLPTSVLSATPTLAITSTSVTATALSTPTAPEQPQPSPIVPTSPPVPKTQPPLSPAALLSAAEVPKPIYQDPLNNQNNPGTLQEGWGTQSSNPGVGAACAFTPNGYMVSLSNGDPNLSNPSWCQAKQPYGDVLIEVTVKVISGGIGLLFRDQYYNNGGWGFYSLEINPGKQQVKAALDANNTYNPLPGLDWRIFPSGVQTGSTHTLQVMVQRNTLYFYVDRTFVAKATDTTYTTGSIGFVCYNPQGSKSGKALFSDVSVRNLSH
jgi:hypothetical protein